jgi:hypothetical protein
VTIRVPCARGVADGDSVSGAGVLLPVSEVEPVVLPVGVGDPAGSGALSGGVCAQPTSRRTSSAGTAILRT